MSKETLRAIEDAIRAHHIATTDTDAKPERAGAIITAWAVGYEIANMVDVGEDHGGTVMGWANNYVTSDSSPNALAHLTQWTSAVIAEALGPFEDDD